MRHPLPETVWPDRETAAASRLFSPVRIGPLRLRTRTWVPAMVPWRSTEEGFVTPEILAWYGRFADGLPGAIVVEATGIRDVKSGPLLRIGHDRFLPGLRDLVRTVRERSEERTRLFVQLIDFLAVRRRPPVDRYLREFLELGSRHRDRLGQLPGFEDVARGTDEEVREALLRLPRESLLEILDPREVEALDFGHRERVGDVHLPHVAELPRVLPDRFAEAARRAREAGFDGVELHFAHAYTMASFLSRTNDRQDGYGGTREERVRLPLEVYHRVRARVGADWVVGCRYLSDEVIPGGSRVEDAAYYGERFAAAGMDFLSISKGGKFDDAKQPKVGEAVYPYTGPSGLECMPTVRIEGAPPFGRNLPLCAAIRARVRAAGHATPIVGAGGINTFELAERALAEGSCDVVAAARQSLADPEWFLKAELGRGDEIRRCIYTNYCEGLDQKHLQVTCQLWDRDLEPPDAGEELGAAPHLDPSGKRRLEPPPWRREREAPLP